MEKLIYLAWGDGQRPEAPGFEDDVVTVARRASCANGVRGASLHVARQGLAAQWLQRPAPPPQTLWCMVSVWVDDLICRAPFEEALGGLGASHVDGYAVAESVPRWRPSPADGEVSAGFQLLSLLHRPDGLTHDAFVDHWIDSHLPLSLSIHPQWTYVRNVISRPITDGARPLDAVCEHGFEKLEHLADPRYFYGAGRDADKLAGNQATIRTDAAKFVDAAAGDVQTTVEYVLSAAFTPRALPGVEYSGPAQID